jgi:diguanylate cyclase (GGDEF)-like protein
MSRLGRVRWLKPWVRLSPSSRRLITLSATLLQLMAVVVSLTMLNMRHVELDNARQDAENLGIAMAEQTSRAVQGIDLVLLETQKDIAAQDITTPEEFRWAMGSQTMSRALNQEGSGLPQAQSFAVIGADGVLVNASGSWPVPAMDLSGTDYFQYLQAHDDKALYLTSPMRGFVNGSWTVFAIRRVDSPSGQFLGLLLGAVNLDYFDDFYRSLVANNGLTVFLLNRNGLVLASYPLIAVTGRNMRVKGPAAPYSPWRSIVASGEPGSYEAPGVLSRGMRLNEVDPLHNYPLVVDVGVSESAVLANWYKDAWIAAGGTAGAMLCVLLMLRALTLQFERLENSEATLAQQNNALMQIEAEMSYVANHDDLTGLMNRRAYHQQLDEAIEQAGHRCRTMAVMYLDLDRFKIANDTRGHEFGDKLLVQLAARLRRLVRATDAVARTGGDEFAIFRPMVAARAEMNALAQVLLEGVREPFEIEGTQCRIGVSIGMAFYPAHGTNSGDLLRNADMALYQAKGDGGDVACTFDESMNARQQEVYAIEQGLRQALELRQFELNYQPIVEVGSGKITACESLLRWRHPERGLIPPMDFIELAESLGLIIPIGYWVIEAACMEAASWPVKLRITVNLSPVQFRDENLFDKLTEILQRTQLPPNQLVFEITEGVLLEDSSHVVGIMNRLRALGIRFSLDDFGTGHSGLGYLRHFPLDAIKIDKIFVRDMEHQAEARAIVVALLTVATALGLEVVAEGIETAGQLAALRQLGCRFVQGYFTGRPKTQREIREILQMASQEKQESVVGA